MMKPKEEREGSRGEEVKRGDTRDKVSLSHTFHLSPLELSVKFRLVNNKGATLWNCPSVCESVRSAVQGNRHHQWPLTETKHSKQLALEREKKFNYCHVNEKKKIIIIPKLLKWIYWIPKNECHVTSKKKEKNGFIAYTDAVTSAIF